MGEHGIIKGPDIEVFAVSASVVRSLLDDVAQEKPARLQRAGEAARPAAVHSEDTDGCGHGLGGHYWWRPD